jgi:hypothetical protein
VKRRRLLNELAGRARHRHPGREWRISLTSR